MGIASPSWSRLQGSCRCITGKEGHTILVKLRCEWLSLVSIRDTCCFGTVCFFLTTSWSEPILAPVEDPAHNQDPRSRSRNLPHSSRASRWPLSTTTMMLMVIASNYLQSSQVFYSLFSPKAISAHSSISTVSSTLCVFIHLYLSAAADLRTIQLTLALDLKLYLPLLPSACPLHMHLTQMGC